MLIPCGQQFIFSIIDSKAPRSITDSTTISQADFITGVPALVVEIELVIFSVFFHYAYSVSMYQLSDEQKRAGQEYQGYGWRLVSLHFYINTLGQAWGYPSQDHYQNNEYVLTIHAFEDLQSL